jgi:hypothetical protein
LGSCFWDILGGYVWDVFVKFESPDDDKNESLQVVFMIAIKARYKRNPTCTNENATSNSS